MAYHDIEIREENLDWMNNENEAVLKNIKIIEVGAEEVHEDDGPAPTQTKVPPENDDEDYKVSGSIKGINKTIPLAVN